MKFDPNSVSQGSSVPSPVTQTPDIPNELAVLPLEGVVVFPLMIAPIVISDDKAKSMVEAVMKGDRMLALFHPVPPGTDLKNSSPATEPRLFTTGTLCSVLRMLRIPDGSLRLLLHGICRVRLDGVIAADPYVRARVAVLDDEDSDRDDLEVEAMMKLTLENLQRAITLSALSEELAVAAMNGRFFGGRKVYYKYHCEIIHY